jgi:Tol biopolymer transport system component
VRAFLPRWSPDGASIAFVDVSHEPWAIRVISSQGAGMRQISPPDQGASDPTWSPKGDRLAFGGVDITHADEPSRFVIQVLDLVTGRLTTLPGSTGLFSPRWSPDGQRMAAINAASELTIVHLPNQERFTLTGLKVGFPSWSRRGDYLYFQDRTNPEAPERILRVSLSSRNVETVAELESVGRLPLGTFTSWSGLSADDTPLLSRDISVQEVYSVRW